MNPCTSHVLPQPDRPLNCLLIYPKFPESAYWNWTEVCRAMGSRAMGIPLGLITFAAMLPEHWRLRVLDLNTTELDDESWQWADLVCVGGMLVQQQGMFEVIRRARCEGKFVVAGGADVTSQPSLYQDANALLLGEAEATVPLWLASWREGRGEGTFSAPERPDITESPVPRFDLLNLKDYLSVNVQFSRGCPFNCEFCDIIELYGRRPRNKTPEQVCRELETLYKLGYRGWIDVVDDNFVGNKRHVKQVLAVLADWCRQWKFPFHFSTQASINLADDEQLMKQMTDVDFRIVFIGIETPDNDVLASTQKRMNALRPISDRIRRINEHGLAVTAGFILGLDGESDEAADAIMECVEENAIPVAMASLLAALPNTQLSRRLAAEGRLLETATYRRIAADETFEVRLPVINGEVPDQANLGGLKFTTTRDRYRILEDHRRIWTTLFDPKRYFSRVLRSAQRVEATRKHRPPPREFWRQNRAVVRMVWYLSRIPGARWPLGKLILRSLFLGQARLEYAMRMAFAYAQLEKICRRVADGVPDRIRFEQSKRVPPICEPIEPQLEEEPIA